VLVARKGNGRRNNDKTVRLWDTTTGRVMATIEGHKSAATFVQLVDLTELLSATKPDGPK
jgi:WD40 repeat protein